MTLADGTPKGMKIVLKEREINTATLKAADMRTILSFHHDFRTERTLVEKFILYQGHQVVFLPKFHCVRRSVTVDNILTTHWLDYITSYILHLIQ